LVVLLTDKNTKRQTDHDGENRTTAKSDGGNERYGRMNRQFLSLMQPTSDEPIELLGTIIRKSGLYRMSQRNRKKVATIRLHQMLTAYQILSLWYLA